MIYSGSNTSDPVTTGVDTQIQNDTFSINNNTFDNNAYVGYMYTLNEVHGLKNNSGIKNILDTWYQSNLTNISDKIDGNAGFCGDREPSTIQTDSNGQGGTGTTYTYYGAYIRLKTNKSPTFECQNSSDLYTTSGSSQGNKTLTYPIGLISADEAAYAGGVYATLNQSYFLYTNQNYWTMSPFTYPNTGMIIIYSNGILVNDNVSSISGIRPVINLKADVTITGSGTTTDPYKVEGA